MEIDKKSRPREFNVGINDNIVLKDCGYIYLKPNEQVTFITSDKKEFDICYKDWGFYATPSVNGRLRRFGFKTVLVENSDRLKYIWLVEEDKEELFNQYISKENHRIIQWLSSELTCICGMNNFDILYTYKKPPHGEMVYDLKGEDYHRELMKCKLCGHFLLNHNYNLEEIYHGTYTQATYQSKLIQTFNKISNLPTEQSDNCGRVNNLIHFCRQYFVDKSLSVLDVGSGLCVFLHLLSQKTNWTLLALDPDPLQAAHAQQVCKIPSICCDFLSLKQDKKFDLITFNKVLEHVLDPIKMLNAAKKHLTKEGLIYIELPDGTSALNESPLREEFFIEHYHAFSMSSLSLLIEKSHFAPLHIERVREPSGKYTIRAFCAHLSE